MAANFKFELVSPEKLLVSEEVSSVVIPATEGEMTVMAFHAPVMTTIKPGIVKVTAASGTVTDYVVFGGFADIVPEGCTLLAESAVPMADISKEDIAKRIEAARKDLEHAESYEHRSALEQFLDELTHLNGVIVPA